MSKPIVTIIGAGISGIKAAVDLTRAGIRVVMIEGRDRIGGRMKTVYPYADNKDVHYDVGASWLHETLENELFPFCVEKDIPLYYDDGVTLYYSDGKPLDPEQKSLRVLSDYTGSTKLKAETELSAAKNENRDAKNPSCKEYAEEFVKTFPLISEENKKIVPRLARTVELHVGIPWNDISIEAEHEITGLGRDAFVKSGYSSVLELIFDQVDKSLFELYLNEEVTAVKSNDNKVEISTANGTKYVSDYAIVTIPAGLLRTIDFGSSLPDKLVNTIKNAHMAELSKVIFEFDEVFWPKEVDRMFVLGNEEEFSPGSCPVLVVNGYRIWKRPCLITFLAPPLSTYLETNPKEAFKYLKPALKTISQTGIVPEPTLTLVTDWQKEKFSQGSYSAIKNNENGWEIINSYKKGADKIRFAGEHTVTEGDGCVHGAYASGKREAKYVIDQLNGLK